MKTPSPVKGEGAVRCLTGDSILSKSRSKSQLMPAPVIAVDGCCVRIIARAEVTLDIPRRQGFAWEENARSYAERLSIERGWPIEVGRRG